MIIINKVVLIGRIVKDTKIEITANGTEVLKNTIAVQRNYKNQYGEYDADFINFVAFKTQAKLIADYFIKGDRIGLSGSWTTNKYENNEGRTIYSNDLIVDGIEFLQEKKPQATQPQPEPVFDDLPF